MPDEHAAPRRDRHLGALFPDREHAVAAVDALRERGFGNEHLGIAVRTDDSTVIERDPGLLQTLEAGAGAVIGAPLGFLGGLALAAVLAPGIAVGGLLALGAVGATGTALVSTYLGMVAGESESLERDRLEAIHRQPGEVLVAVRSSGQSAAVTELLVEHGGRLIDLGGLDS